MGSCGDLIKMSGGGEEGFLTSFHPSAGSRRVGIVTSASSELPPTPSTQPPQTEACFSTTHGFNWRLLLPLPPLLQLLLCLWLKEGGKK